MNKIPVSAARKVAEEFNQKQVIIVTWDGELTYVITYGKTIEDCAQAALGGNRVKTALGWPESLHSEPPRVKKLQKEIEDLKATLKELSDWIKSVDMDLGKDFGQDELVIKAEKLLCDVKWLIKREFDNDKTVAEYARTLGFRHDPR